jgi:hypothetical protein
MDHDDFLQNSQFTLAFPFDTNLMINEINNISCALISADLIQIHSGGEKHYNDPARN